MGLISKLCDNCSEKKHPKHTDATPENGVIILSPINGEISSVDDDKIIIKYDEDDCKFNVVIEGSGKFDTLVDKGQRLDQGQQIGTGGGGKITLTVPPNFGGLNNDDLKDYYNGTPKRCTKKTKTKDPNEDNSGNNNKKIADRDPDIDRMVYGRAAYIPFGLWQGVTSPFTTESEEEKINLLEDISRIKELMK